MRIHKLHVTERPKVTYEFTVEGRGQFPTDMLRYDACWPIDPDSAVNVTARDYNGPRRVRLRSYREPTQGRWASFLWYVRSSES